MAENIAIIKSRVLQYIEYHGITKENFYKKISMRGQSWRGKGAESELSADKIAKVIAEYRDINPYWLLLGEGEMIKTPETNSDSPSSTEKDEQIKKLEMWLRDKEKIIQGLEYRLEKYEQKQPKAGGTR